MLKGSQVFNCVFPVETGVSASHVVPTLYSSLPQPPPVTSSLFDRVVTDVACKYPDLTTNVVSDANTRWCIIQQHVYTPGPLRTPVHNPRIVVKEVARQEATFTFEVHFGYEFDHGSVSDDRFDVLLRTLLPGSGYELCPGLPDDVRTQLTFESKSA